MKNKNKIMILTKEIVLEKNLIDENGHCTVPDCYTEIGWWAFENCTSLTSIDLPNSITEIGHNAFWNCTSLKSIKLPNNITKIGEYAFGNCKSLKSISLPNNLKKIGNSAFCNCTSLTSINLPNNITEIGRNAFWNCINLPKINIGKEILEIALKDNYFEEYCGLCICFRQIVSELILKYRKPIYLEVELPMFTVENAIKCANGTDGHYWFENNSDRKRFLEWMLFEINKNNFNDEILILRR